MLVYKILRPAEWATFESSGHYVASPDDLRSGFVHCSSRQQVAATAQRFFAGEAELVVLSVGTDMLGDSLRWEAASDGERFPHIYGDLPRGAVVDVHRVAGAAHVDDALGAGAGAGA